MAVKRMEDFINKSRNTFRTIIRNHMDEEVLMTFLKEHLEYCCSEFEENTLIENLAEEYKEYLKKVAEASGE